MPVRRTASIKVVSRQEKEKISIVAFSPHEMRCEFRLHCTIEDGSLISARDASCLSELSARNFASSLVHKQLQYASSGGNDASGVTRELTIAGAAKPPAASATRASPYRITPCWSITKVGE